MFKKEPNERKEKKAKRQKKKREEKMLTLFDTGYGKAINGGPGKRVTSTELTQAKLEKKGEGGSRTMQRKETRRIQFPTLSEQAAILASDIRERVWARKG